MQERCDFVADLVNHNRPAVVWCHMNDEGDRLEDCIPDAEQIAGRTPDDRKIELYEAFASGQLRVLVIKPKIGAWGLNWQHCARMAFVGLSFSYEAYYQAIRRCWRFGQRRLVTVDVVSTEGERGVLANLQRKAEQADRMFANLVAEMNTAISIDRAARFTATMEVPSWLSTVNS
jgi:hypothetical protein